MKSKSRLYSNRKRSSQCRNSRFESLNCSSSSRCESAPTFFDFRITQRDLELRSADSHVRELVRTGSRGQGYPRSRFRFRGRNAAMLLAAVTLMACAGVKVFGAQSNDYDARARKIVAQMTLDEKIAQLHGIRDKNNPCLFRL